MNYLNFWSFILSSSFSTLFIRTKSSWRIFESIKALEMKTSLLFNFDLDNNNILSCFLFFFLFINLYLLIPAVMAQIFNPIAELVIPMDSYFEGSYIFSIKPSIFNISIDSSSLNIFESSKLYEVCVLVNSNLCEKLFSSLE